MNSSICIHRFQVLHPKRDLQLMIRQRIGEAMRIGVQQEVAVADGEAGYGEGAGAGGADGGGGGGVESEDWHTADTNKVVQMLMAIVRFVQAKQLPPADDAKNGGSRGSRGKKALAAGTTFNANASGRAVNGGVKGGVKGEGAGFVDMGDDQGKGGLAQALGYNATGAGSKASGSKAETASRVKGWKKRLSLIPGSKTAKKSAAEKASAFTMDPRWVSGLYICIRVMCPICISVGRACRV
jgi:hypothetical protein